LKGGLIPDSPSTEIMCRVNGFEQSIPVSDGPASYQLVGEVTAHQGDDG